MMTSRERVLTALSHRTPDRVPIDVAHYEVGADVQTRLQKHFYVKDLQTILLGLGTDFRWIEPLYRGPELVTRPDGTYIGFFGQAENVLSYAEGLGLRPLQNAETIAEIERYPWPQADWFDFSVIPTLCNLYHDFAIVGPARWKPTFCRICELTGMETTLQNLILAPELIEAMTACITDFYYEFSKRALEAAKGRIDVFFIGDDYAGQKGMIFSLEYWRKYFKRPLARMFALAHSYGARVMFHSCGAIRELLPELIDIGLDIIMPLQLRADGMDPAGLKRDFGKSLSFYGGVDVQQTMVYGTEQDVRAEVRMCIDTLGRDGGYVLTSSHILLPEMPLGNILAMFDEAQHYVPN